MKRMAKGQTGSNTASSKAVLRALRFLSAGPARMRPAAAGESLLLEAGERGTISISREAIAGALRSQLMTCGADGRLQATPDGLAALRRDEDGAYLMQHREIEQRQLPSAEGATQTVSVNLRESPLAQLARRRDREGRPLLDEREVAAGERLRSDYDRAMIMPRLGINWEAPVGGGGSGGGLEELTETALAARQRVEKALEAVGPELSGVLVDICCFLKGLEQVEAERGWPVRSAKIVLKSALGSLSRHYQPGAANKRRILHWGAEGYRPHLDAGIS